MNTLGLVTITAGGTPQALTGDPGRRAAFVLFTPKPGNAAPVYIGVKGMVVASGVNVAGVIPKPAAATTGPFAGFLLPPLGTGGGYNLSAIYIDGTTSDGVYVAYL